MLDSQKILFSGFGVRAIPLVQKMDRNENSRLDATEFFTPEARAKKRPKVKSFKPKWAQKNQPDWSLIGG